LFKINFRHLTFPPSNFCPSLPIILYQRQIVQYCGQKARIDCSFPGRPLWLNGCSQALLSSHEVRARPDRQAILVHFWLKVEGNGDFEYIFPLLPSLTSNSCPPTNPPPPQFPPSSLQSAKFPITAARNLRDYSFSGRVAATPTAVRKSEDST